MSSGFLLLFWLRGHRRVSRTRENRQPRILRNPGSLADGQQFGKADLVPVRISDVKEALAPGGILRRLSHQSWSLQRPVVRVYVIDAENRSPPPPVFVSWTRHQVDEGFTSFQTAERRVFISVQQLESKLSVEFD